MKRWRRHRPSPGLIVACVALFVALGGTVMAATKKIDGRTIKAKSLPGNRLVVGSLPGDRLKPGTIQGSRLAPGTLTGTQIDTASIGQVPDAAHAESADSARRAQSATVADHATDATTVNGRSVGCPSTAREFAGACWDLRPSEAALTAPQAAAECADAGGELPSLLALMSFVQESGVQPVFDGEWMRDVRVDSGGVYNVPILENGTAVALKSPTEPHRFRCVIPLVS